MFCYGFSRLTVKDLNFIEGLAVLDGEELELKQVLSKIAKGKRVERHDVFRDKFGDDSDWICS